MADRKKNPALILGEIGLLSSLGGLDIPLIVGSEVKKNPVMYSKYVDQYYLLPSYDSREFIDRLCEIGKTLDKKAVLFSDDDRAILNISNHRQRLQEYYLMLYPSIEMVNGILDKQMFVELTNRYQLPAPMSFELDSMDKFECVASQITYPCIIKPAQRHYWWGENFIQTFGSYKKAIKCFGYESLKNTYQKIRTINPNVVIQEYVEGNDRQHYSANLFVDQEGMLMGYYIAQKLRIYPIKAGVGTYVETVSNSEVLQTSMDIIHKLDLRGLVNVQFKQDSRTNEYKLMEVHARNSQWSLLGKKAGANLALKYYNYLVSTDNEDISKAKPGVKYFNLQSDIKAMMDYRAEGTLTIKEWWKSLQGDRVFFMISLKDPKPMLMQLWFTISRKFKSKEVIYKPVARLEQKKREKEAI